VTAVTGAAITELAPRVGIRAACRAVGAAQAGWYRRHRDSPAPARPAPVPHRQRRQPRALAPAERQAITGVLHGERLADVAPAEARATLLEEGTYPGSAPTFYLVLRERGEVRERRRQAARPATVKPELMAGHPNAVRSWDITKLAGPAKWTWHYLYVITDICSRHVTGWMVATRESAALAERLIAGTCAKQGIGPGKLTIHADRGSSMTSRPVAFLLAGPGITQSRSRPRVSNDNPYSESQFKTPKYRPGFPARSGSIEHARAHCQEFFPWYNREHRHAGLGLHTAADVRHGRAQAVRAARAEVPSAAHAAQPGTVRPPAAAAEATRHVVDQPAREGGRRSVNPAHRCLIQVARFRRRAGTAPADHPVQDRYRAAPSGRTPGGSPGRCARCRARRARSRRARRRRGPPPPLPARRRPAAS